MLRALGGGGQRTAGMTERTRQVAPILHVYWTPMRFPGRKDGQMIDDVRSQSDTSDMERCYFERDGLRLAYVDSAPDQTDRPAVLMIHGFPDTADLWAHQVRDLQAQGFRVIAPDTRGHGASDLAARAGDYHWSEVVADLLGLLDHLGLDQVDVVGHDWGAAFAWLLAGRHPARVRRLVVISVGHPTAYARSGLRQKLRSWYILYFLLAGIAEWTLRLPFFPGFRAVFTSHPDPGEVKARMAAPGRWRAALRVYRANVLSVLLGRHPKVRAPTLGIYSRGDAHLVERQMVRSDQWVHGRFRYVPVDGGHWVPMTHADVISRLIIEHLTSSQP